MLFWLFPWNAKEIVQNKNLCCICNRQNFSYQIKINTRTTSVWKRHGTAHKAYGRLGGAIEQQRQKEMARNNRRENASRISHDYKVGDKVFLKKPGNNLIKLEAPRIGPCTATAMYTNGTMCIQNGRVNERVSIRRLRPYFEHTDQYGSECIIPCV
jgi:hypothetical protein